MSKRVVIAMTSKYLFSPPLQSCAAGRAFLPSGSLFMSAFFLTRFAQTTSESSNHYESPRGRLWACDGRKERICYSQYGHVFGNCFLRLDVPLIFTGISGFKSLVYGKVLNRISSYICSIKRLFHPQ